MCDEKSKIIDGDQIIAMIAKRWKRKKILKGGVVGTLMSNYGLQSFFLNENYLYKLPCKHAKHRNQYCVNKIFK